MQRLQLPPWSSAWRRNGGVARSGGLADPRSSATAAPRTCSQAPVRVLVADQQIGTGEHRMATTEHRAEESGDPGQGDERAANARPDLLADSMRMMIAAEVERRIRGLESAPRLAREGRFLTVAEAASVLRCKPQRVYDLLSQRRLSRVKEGGRTLLLRDEVEALPATTRPAR